MMLEFRRPHMGLQADSSHLHKVDPLAGFSIIMSLALETMINATSLMHDDFSIRKSLNETS